MHRRTAVRRPRRGREPHAHRPGAAGRAPWRMLTCSTGRAPVTAHRGTASIDVALILAGNSLLRSGARGSRPAGHRRRSAWTVVLGAAAGPPASQCAKNWSKPATSGRMRRRCPSRLMSSAGQKNSAPSTKKWGEPTTPRRLALGPVGQDVASATHRTGRWRAEVGPQAVEHGGSLTSCPCSKSASRTARLARSPTTRPIA